MNVDPVNYFDIKAQQNETLRENEKLIGKCFLKFTRYLFNLLMLVN